MAAAGRKPIGSAAWIAAEKENVTRLLEQEMEEVEYPVRHEMDWLNEHMAEIFSRNQFNMTEIFKTPGKMRGKTPRTARKRNPDEARVPLSDIFSTANQRSKSPSKPAKSLEKQVTSQMPNKQAAESVPREPVNTLTQEPIKNPPMVPMNTSLEKPISYPDIKGKQPVRDLQPTKTLNSFSTYNTDSGYHGLGDDDDELVLPGTQPLPDTQLSDDTHVNVMAPIQSLSTSVVHGTQDRKSFSVDRRTTEGSFVSAQENIVSRGQTVEPMDVENDQQDKADEDTPRPFTKAAQGPRTSLENPTDIQRETLLNDNLLDKDGDIVIDDNFDDIGSPSDGSTPARPLRKKSSLSFASLPAREPLMTKKSMGPRISRTSHVEIIKPSTMGRQSYFTSQSESSRPGVSNPATEKEESHQENMDWDRKGRQLQQGDAAVGYDTSVLHNKSSTQRLHDKISMLGKTQAPRTTKSIAPTPHITTSQVNYPDLPSTKNNNADMERVPTLASAAQEDWIKPLASPSRPGMTKSQTADIMELVAGNETVGNLEKGKITRTETFHDLSDRRSPTPKRSGFAAFDQHKSIPAATPPSSRRPESSAMPASNKAVESTTPLTSPRRLDGTLSGPKSRFQSIMKSAKSLFSSSASISAAAKLDMLSSPSASRSQPNLQHMGTSPERYSPSPERLPTRKRSATETKSNLAVKPVQLEDPFDVEHRTRQVKAAEPSAKLEKSQKMQPKERDVHEPTDISASNQANAKKTQRTQPPARKDPAADADSEPKFPLPPSTSHNQTQPARQRPVKPTRETTQKPKPQPMSIRVGSTLSRMPVASTATYNPEPSSGPTPVSAKQPGLSKKASNSSLQTTASNTSFKSSVSSQSQRRVQAAAAAAAAESKKQEEREAMLRKEEQKKRAAQQKQQQEDARRQERERSVVDDNKKSTQRQAIEQRRLENSRIRQGSQPPRPANDLGTALPQEKTTIQRTDMGPARPPSRLGSSMQPFSRSINQPPNNPAKPAKRHLEEESQHRPPASASQAKSQTAEAKRRKTEDEYNQQQYMQPASLKQQPIRKENGKLSLLAHAYPQAPPPAAHHQAGLYKAGSVQTGVAGQQLKHAAPIDMTQYTSGTIPFAPNNATHAGTAHKTPSHKTPKPGPSAQRVPAKASPQYPPSESIHLPEPPTDSEDEDSDADMMPVPNWAQGPALNAALGVQETWQVDKIFGPIPPFSMEDAFKQDKKIKKFRERTSSANWGGPDGLTQDEITRDMAARRIMRANGGWSYNVS